MSRGLRARARRLARSLPGPAREVLERVRGSRRLRRVASPVRWGNLRRVQPYSARFGFDRGTPIDRYYLDAFFARHTADLRGRVLEVRDPKYTRRFGSGVTSLDLVDIDPRNDDATIVADLAETDSLPAGAFDCILLPQTLQYVADLDAAVANAWQSLVPGGALLVTVPAISKVDHHQRDGDRWRLTPAGLTCLLRRGCPSGEIDVVGYGNVLTATAFLMGLAAEELRPAELAAHDPDYAVVTCGRASKERE